MNIYNIIKLSMITTILMVSLFSISILNANVNYENSKIQLQEALNESNPEQYFNVEVNKYKFVVDNRKIELETVELCQLCDSPLNNMFNSKSKYIISAPDDICDLTIEKCIYYEFDPFGIDIFKKREILRSKI